MKMLSVLDIRVLLLILTCLLLFACIHVKQIYKYWKKKGIAFDPPVLFFGSMMDVVFAKRNLSQVLKHIYDCNPSEKYVGLFKGIEPMLLVRDPALIKAILVKDFHHFQDRDAVRNLDVDVLSASLVNLHGDEWKYLRQKITPTFTSSKIRHMFELIVNCGLEFQKFLDLQVGADIEAREMMAKYTTEVIGNCAFGVETNSMVNEHTPFRIMGRKIFEYKPVKNIIREMMPFFFRYFKMTLQPDDVNEFFLNLVGQILADRDVSKLRRNDFIDLMIDVKKSQCYNDGIGYIELTHPLMTAQSFVFFAAGFETSSAVMSFALHELAFNADVQNKAFEEIDRVLSKYDGKLTYDAINEMKYIDMIVQESLRMYPPVSVLRRKCTDEYVIPGTEILLNKELAVAISIVGLHYDPQFYPDPKVFDPERFSRDEREKRTPCVFLPFGDGPRNCIGVRFARVQSMVGLISILQKFKIEPSTRSTRIIELDTRTLITAAKNGVFVKLSRRG